MIFVKKIYKILKSFFASTKRLNIDAYAACTAFFLVLSLVPTMILLCSILPLTPLTEIDLVNFLQGIFPPMFEELIAKLVSSVYEGGYAVLTVSAVITLWVAGKSISSLMQALNAVFGIEEKRNFFIKRLVCSLYTLVFLAIVLVSLLLMVFSKSLEKYLCSVWDGFGRIEGVLLRPRYLYLFIILTLVFGLVYAFLPNKKQRFREMLPGAMFSSACWIGFSFFFALYVNRFNPYNMYGNLAMVIVAMIWIYFCLLFFMYGAYLNKYFKPINVVLLYPSSSRHAKEIVKEEKQRQDEEEAMQMQNMLSEQDVLD